MPTLDTTYTPNSVATTTPTSEGGGGYDPLSALMARIVMAKMNRQRQGDGTVGIQVSGTSAAQDRAESEHLQDRHDARRRAMLAEEAQAKAAKMHPITQEYYGITGKPVHSWDIPGMRASFAEKG